MLEKPVFLAYPQDLVIDFLIFAQRWVLAMLKTWSSSIFKENFFSGRKCRKYAGNRRFGRFSSDFFLIFLYFFTEKRY